tara:strand:+ start:7564 stop:8070 length:507 start_codon:yes stop_codon:yes gene_type:complete
MSYNKNLSFNIRVFFSKLLNKVLLRVLKHIDYSFANVRYKKKAIYYETKLFNISQFEYILKNKSTKDVYEIDTHPITFDWKRFVEDIKCKGVKHNPIVIKSFQGPEFQTFIFDGFHRVKACEMLYGKNYKMKMDVYVHYDYLKNKKQLKDNIQNIFKNRLKELKSKEK